MQQTYPNMHVCSVCVCDRASLWLVRLALFTLPPPPLASSLGMTAIMRMAPAANKCGQHTSLILLRGGTRAAALNANKPPFSCQKLWQWSRVEQGDEVERGKWAIGATWTERRGELIRPPLSQGRSLTEGGDAFSRGTRQLELIHGLNFWTRQQDLRRNWFSTPPQRWHVEVSLFAVAIETGICGLSTPVKTAIPL